MILPSIAAVAMSILMSGAAFAVGTPRLDQREQNQRQRVGQGVRSGELTRPETRRLVKGQVHVRRLEGRAKADADVTKRERVRLEHTALREREVIGAEEGSRLRSRIGRINKIPGLCIGDQQVELRGAGLM